MVEAGFITARPCRAPRARRGITLATARPARARAISPIGSPSSSREFAGTGNRDLIVAHDARPADAGRGRRRRSPTSSRATARKDRGQAGRAGGDGARRRGPRDGRRPRLRRRASSTARPRRSASPARPSSRSSISPGWRPGCGPRTGSSTRRSGSATGSRAIIRPLPGRDDARRGAGAVGQHDRGAGRAARRHAQCGRRRPTGSALPRRWPATPSLALGTNEVNLLELVSAYAPFANGGNGVLALRHHRNPRRRAARSSIAAPAPGRASVVAPELVGAMNQMLARRHRPRHRQERGAAARPAAGKTGTTQEYRDAWFIGYTADLVAGVWLGNDDNTPMNKVTGGSLPAARLARFHAGGDAGHAGAAVAERPGAIRGRRRIGPRPAIRLADRRGDATGAGRLPDRPRSAATATRARRRTTDATAPERCERESRASVPIGSRSLLSAL